MKKIMFAVMLALALSACSGNMPTKGANAKPTTPSGAVGDPSKPGYGVYKPNQNGNPPADYVIPPMPM